MKLKVIIITIFIFISTIGISQNKRVFRIGTFGQIGYIDNNILPQYGISAELFVTDNISLNYKYGMGLNPNGDITGHFNPSLFLLPFAYSFEAILAVLLIPEGISYHIYLSDYFELAPYISPLSAEANLYDDRPLVLSGSLGFNAYFKNATPFNNLMFGINAGSIIIYRVGSAIPVLGISLNYCFQ